MKRHLILSSISATLAIVASGCWDYVDAPVPTVGPGQCEYHDEPYNDQASAQSAMVSIASKLSTVSVSGKKVVITNQQTYKTSYETRKGKERNALWGYQIVFNCSNAEIKFETQKGFTSSLHAENALNNRKFAIIDLANAFGGDVRFLAQEVVRYAAERIDNCYNVYDPYSGTYYRDCDTVYNDLFKFNLDYAIVKNDGAGSSGGRIASGGRLASHLSDIGLTQSAQFEATTVFSSIRTFTGASPKDQVLPQGVKFTSGELNNRDEVISAFADINGTSGMSGYEVASKGIKLISLKEMASKYDNVPFISTHDDYVFFKNVVKAIH